VPQRFQTGPRLSGGVERLLGTGSIRFLTHLFMTDAKYIEVVAGLLFKDGRLLACQRPVDGPFPLKWEFPGGKIEPGEETANALVRELREELAIDAEKIEEVFTHTHIYPGFFTVKLKFFHVLRYHGPFDNRIFEQIRWVSAQELAAMDFLDGDRPVIEWLLSRDGGALWHP
jgi:8-oxo-dGTP diphosphatase